MPPIIDIEKCIGCAVCYEICPVDVLTFNAKEKKPNIKYPEECWHCNSCVLDCPQKAVTLRVPLPSTLLYMDAKTATQPD